MTREQIKDFKEIVLPFFKNYLLKVNYENRGKSDAEVFEKDFNEIIELANKALEQEPFMNKPCISGGVCEHDKNKALDKIRAEIEKLQTYKMFVGEDTVYVERDDVLAIIDKHKGESGK